jgi:hypothetical protein
VLFPYLNGEDLNSRPDQSPSRWVINFHSWPLERAEQYPEVMAIVRERVKPERDRNNRKQYRDRWWYAERRPALYKAIAGFDRVLAVARVSKTVAPVFVPAGIVASEQIVVFAYDDDTHFGLLPSALLWWWAVTRSLTLETRIRYTPSDVSRPLRLLTSTWPRFSRHPPRLAVHTRARATYRVARPPARTHPRSPRR